MSTFEEAQIALIVQQKGSKRGDRHLCYDAMDKQVYAFQFGLGKQELSKEDKESTDWVIE